MGPIHTEHTARTRFVAAVLLVGGASSPVAQSAATVQVLETLCGVVQTIHEWHVALFTRD